MYRIGAVAACVAAFVGITAGNVFAAACDERVAGSCPIEPIVETVDTSTATESVTPLAYARAGKERGVRRARRVSRPVRRAERRAPARAVQVARMQEEASPPRRQPAGPSAAAGLPAAAPSAAAGLPTAAPSAAAGLPTATTILSPTFVRDARLQGAIPDAGRDGGTPTQPTTAPLNPGASDAASEPSDAASPALVQVADNATESAPQRVELMQAAASAPSDPAETPWLRFAILAFGGVLAFGSAIRLFV